MALTGAERQRLLETLAEKVYGPSWKARLGYQIASANMYHLFVSGNDDAWSGEPWIISPRERGRCLNEYTDPALHARYGALGTAEINELRRYPCVFAYERGIRKDPLFGVIRDIVNRSTGIKVEYEILPLAPFLSARDLVDLSFDLEIGEWELGRTHWALKDVNLAKELRQRSIELPAWARPVGKGVDIATHEFDVALSFPGEVRPYVKEVCQELERMLGPNRYFYDDNYVAQLAQPSLDSLLQGLYGKRSKLIVVFVCAEYQHKRWCGIEFRSIKEIINRKEHNRVMFVRMDDAVVEGVFDADGYVDGRKYAAVEVAGFIAQRVELLPLRIPTGSDRRSDSIRS